MKKIIIFIFITILLCGLKSPFTKSLNRLEIFSNSSFEIFTSSKTDISCNKISNGNGEILFLDYHIFVNTYKNLNNITGFNIYTNNSKEYILKGLNAYNIITLNNNIYAYSPIVNSLLSQKNVNDVIINNKLVNIQISCQETQNILGFPINLGSY